MKYLSRGGRTERSEARQTWLPLRFLSRKTDRASAVAVASGVNEPSPLAPG